MCNFSRFLLFQMAARTAWVAWKEQKSAGRSVVHRQGQAIRRAGITRVERMTDPSASEKTLLEHLRSMPIP